MSAVLLACVRDTVGPDGVKQVLELAGPERSPDYLSEISNWISYEEAVALWHAGAQITHHPQFARMVGEAAAKRLNSSPVAALLRSLGSPEACYRQITVMSTKFTAVAAFEAVEVGPGSTSTWTASSRSTTSSGTRSATRSCRWSASA